MPREHTWAPLWTVGGPGPVVMQRKRVMRGSVDMSTFQSPLETPVDELQEAGTRVSEILQDWNDGVRGISPSPTIDIEELRASLGSVDFESGSEAVEVVNQVADWLRSGTVHTTHPRYLGLFNPTPLPVGQIADMLTAGFNPQLAVWSHAPAAVEMEQAVLRFVADRLGFSGGHAMFTTGGAEANASAVAVALTRVAPDVASGGIASLPGQPVMYASAESHLAWLKIAHQSGVGRDQVRLVEVDDQLRLDPVALRRAIDQDRAAGKMPFLVVATVGTTGAGIVDQVDRIAEITGEAGCHLHVDAAWAGAAAMSDDLRPFLGRIELADSITVDAHKWLSVPMGAGMFFARDTDAVASTFEVSTSYMPPATTGAIDPYAVSVQWSRRFIGLKLYMALAVVGRRGYARQLEHDVVLGDHLRQLLVADGWRIVNDTPLPVVCFDRPGIDDADIYRRIARRVAESGNGWISTVSIRGRTALRACITSFRTTEADLETIVQALSDAL